MYIHSKLNAEVQVIKVGHLTIFSAVCLNLFVVVIVLFVKIYLS